MTFGTILDNLNSIQNEMVAMFKQQYEWGRFGDKTTANTILRGYVRSNALAATGYKEITGEDYVEEANGQPKA